VPTSPNDWVWVRQLKHYADTVRLQLLHHKALVTSWGLDACNFGHCSCVGISCVCPDCKMLAAVPALLGHWQVLQLFQSQEHVEASTVCLHFPAML